MWARLPIAVDGRPLTDIEVPLQVGGRLSGRVVFEGTGAPPEGDELTTIAVRVQSADGDVTRLPIVRLDGSGRFTSPGRFTAGDGEPARGHHVHDADDCRTLQTTRSDEQGRFSFTGFTPDRALWTRFSRRIQSARPSGDGRYTFRYLPPGDYLLAAVDDVEPGEWYDPVFLQSLVESSIKVSLAEGEQKTQDLRLAVSR